MKTFARAVVVLYVFALGAAFSAQEYKPVPMPPPYQADGAPPAPVLGDVQRLTLTTKLQAVGLADQQLQLAKIDLAQYLQTLTVKDYDLDIARFAYVKKKADGPK